MCDHAHPLAAAFRAAGFRAEVLPPSDEKTLELGRKFTSGKECHPYTVTTGDILKKVNEPGFDAGRSAFLIPTASGPCRFGQYQQAQNLLFQQIGYEDILLFSPDVKDSYGRSTGLGMDFRRRVWQGVVASDLLDELTSGTRPYEKEEGAIDRLARHHLERICRELEKDKYDLKPVIREMKRDFAAMPLTGSNHKPLIGIVGEIFLRLNPRCNGGIVKKLEEFGGVTRTAPISEWIYYTGLGYIYESWMRKKFGSLLQALAADAAQRLDERRLGYRQPSALKLIRKAAPYLHYSFKGEAVLTIGKAIDLIEHGASGIVNIMPFTCMPGTVVAAAARKLREDHPGIPWLDVSIDGNEGVNLETRLEAFMHQASCYNEVIPIPRK
jgi:predicted nucleotide-binding protein (sugar kinase/HSP70/actin superfamily)